jgi:hypothetical protein
MAVSLAIFAVIYFTVIQPDNNTANQAIKSGLQQSQQALNQAQQQLKNSGVNSSQAQRVVSNASQLTQCVAAAGTDVTKAQACAAKFGH